MTTDQRLNPLRERALAAAREARKRIEEADVRRETEHQQRECDNFAHLMERFLEDDFKAGSITYNANGALRYIASGGLVFAPMGFSRLGFVRICMRCDDEMVTEFEDLMELGLLIEGGAQAEHNYREACSVRDEEDKERNAVYAAQYAAKERAQTKDKVERFMDALRDLFDEVKGE